MERCEPPRARRAGARRRRRRRPLADWQLRDIARVASQHRAAGYHAVKVHGVLIVFRHTREVQHAGDGRGHQRTVGDAPTASSAKPEQLSKRKQRSSMRLADFRRRMEQRDQAAASKLRRLWSVVWLQRLVRRRLGERSRLAAGVAIVGDGPRRTGTVPLDSTLGKSFTTRQILSLSEGAGQRAAGILLLLLTLCFARS